MSTKETVRIAALGDLHYGRTSAPGSLQPLFSQINEVRRRPRAVRRPHRLRPRRRSASARQRAHSVHQDSDRRRPRQPRLRIQSAGRDRGKSSRTPASSMLDGDTTEVHGIGFAGVKGFAAVSDGARSARGAKTSSRIRARSGRRSAEARVGARAPAHRPSDRGPALRADPGDGRRRTARHLPVPRVQSPRGPDHAFPSPPSSTDTRITAGRRDAPARTSRSSTSRCR